MSRDAAASSSALDSVPASTAAPPALAALQSDSEDRALNSAVAYTTILLLASPAPGASRPDVRVVREGAPLTVSNPERVADLFVAVVESSSVNSTKYVSPKGRWNASASAHSLVHVTFPSGRILSVMDAANRDWRPTLIEELAIVVPSDAWPDHVMLKTAKGILSVTKYAPCPIVRLMRATDLAVLDKSHERYGDPRLACGEDSP